jgi:hypothetical protein
LPSSANFIFASHPSKDAGELAQQLREQGIIVRYFNKPRINQFLRITIGTDEQNQRLVDTLKTCNGNSTACPKRNLILEFLNRTNQNIPRTSTIKIKITH